jgi:hypothetical protein
MASGSIRSATPEPGATSNFCNAIHEYGKSIGKDNFIIFAEIVEGTTC